MQNLYDEFYKQNKFLINIYIFTFLILVLDLTSLLINLNSSNKFKQKAQNFNSWIFVSPLLIEWFITLGFFINFRHRTKKLKSKIKILIDDKKKMLKCYREENAHIIFKSFKFQGRHFKNTKFKNLLKSILLFLLPIILRTAVFRNAGYKEIFTVSASLFYGYNILIETLHFIIKKRKQCNYNKKLSSEILNNSYKSINVNDSNSYFHENIEQDNNDGICLNDIDINLNHNEIFERNIKLKSKLGENYLDISFFVVKCLVGILFVMYFSTIGEKLDDNNGSCTWIVLFIPFYIFCFISFFFCILHCLSLYSIFKEKIWKPVLTLLPCIITFISNCFIIPLKLENRITLHSSFITVFFTAGTIFFLLHLLVLNKKL